MTPTQILAACAFHGLTAEEWATLPPDVQQAFVNDTPTVEVGV